jgi:hypothetical protein
MTTPPTTDDTKAEPNYGAHAAGATLWRETMPPPRGAVRLTEDADWDAIATWCCGEHHLREQGDSGEYESVLTVMTHSYGIVDALEGDWIIWERRGFAVWEHGPFIANHQPAEAADGERPRIVCLCGSTRFVDEFNHQRKILTEAGEIVLSIEVVTTQAREDDPQHANPELKARLDELHKRKIDLADYVLVLNVGGYVGESTRGEIDYAHGVGKPVTWLEPDRIPAEFTEVCRCSAVSQ